MKKILALFCAGMIAAVSCKDNNNDKTAPAATSDIDVSTPVLRYTVVNVLPHDTASFTQGLVVYNGQLYESTGTYDRSWLGPVDMKTGKINRKVVLGPQYFGEGMTILNNKVYQLTWTTKRGFVYDLKTFKKIKEFSYPTEGWGLTTDGKNLIMSDGSSNLYFLDPESLQVVKKIDVTDNNGAIPNLNELEYINGAIYANQWQTHYIYKIDPSSGKVLGRMDLKGLEDDLLSKYPNFTDEGYVLNGIAFDSANNKVYITGKKWPSLYEIRLQ